MVIQGRDFCLRPLQPGDIGTLACTMREADRREVKRWSGNDPLRELDFSVRHSDSVWAGCSADGTLLCIFGGCRSNVLESTGLIWELSSEAVHAHWRTFARASRAGFEAVCRDLCDVQQFCNWVDTDYTAAVRWIERLGGAMSIAPAVHGPFGGVFRQFWIMNPFYKE